MIVLYLILGILTGLAQKIDTRSEVKFKPVVCVLNVDEISWDDLFLQPPVNLLAKKISLKADSDSGAFFVVNPDENELVNQVVVRICDFYDGWAFWNWLKKFQRLECPMDASVRWPVQVRKVMLDWLNREIWVQGVDKKVSLVTHLLPNCRWPNPVKMGPLVKPFQTIKVHLSGDNWQATINGVAKSFGFESDIVWVSLNSSKITQAIVMSAQEAQLWQP